MRRHPRRAAVDRSSPRAWATDDRSGFVGNHENLRYQFEWAGTGLINTGILVFPDELDVPQRQLGTIVLPPDPPTILTARPEPYAIDEVSSEFYFAENGVDQYITEDSGVFAVFYTSSGS